MTVWQSVTVLTLRRTSLQVPLFQGKVGFHENHLAQSKPDQSYVVLDREDVGLEQPEELRVFYRSSRGPGALGTILSFWSIVTLSLAPHNPSVTYLLQGQDVSICAKEEVWLSGR